MNYSNKSPNRFSQTQVEYALRTLLDKMLEGKEYDAKNAVALSKEVSTAVLEQVKRTKPHVAFTMLEMNYPRYKFVVQTAITENVGQGIRIGSRCLWHKKYDNYASISFKNVCPLKIDNNCAQKTLTCVVIVFGCFYE